MVAIEVFARALDRAIESGCRVRESEDFPGLLDVRSGDGRSWYVGVSLERCGCKAGRGGRFCKHKALVAYVTQRVEDVVGRVSYNRVWAQEAYEELMERDAA